MSTVQGQGHLNTKCGGRAWVMVTSQEDMDKVVGDRTKGQGNDFSKIQARFKTRVKLTSADVEEVIRKRLLEKNGTGGAALTGIYAKESANFKTLFDFVDGAKTYRNYADEAHFVGTYPFVSYQFPLFQAAIEGISDHNAFEGRNSSVGERSMLGVVQQVAKDIGNVDGPPIASCSRWRRAMTIMRDPDDVVRAVHPVWMEKEALALVCTSRSCRLREQWIARRYLHPRKVNVLSELVSRRDLVRHPIASSWRSLVTNMLVRSEAGWLGAGRVHSGSLRQEVRENRKFMTLAPVAPINPQRPRDEELTGGSPSVSQDRLAKGRRG